MSIRSFLRFRLRTLLILFVAASAFLTFWPRNDEQIYPVGLGKIQMDRSLSMSGREILVHVTGALSDRNPQSPVHDSPLGNHLVVVVPDCNQVTRGDAVEIARHPELSDLNPEVHFIELANQNSAMIRSFGGVWTMERSESLSGALASVMAMDQLSFRVPQEIRKPFGDAVSPTLIQFSNGRVLTVNYTNDWGAFYLREVQGPTHLIERLRTKPYSDRERMHAKRLLERGKQQLPGDSDSVAE